MAGNWYSIKTKISFLRILNTRNHEQYDILILKMGLFFCNFTNHGLHYEIIMNSKRHYTDSYKGTLSRLSYIFQFWGVTDTYTDLTNELRSCASANS